ncbi:ABC transporter permease [Caldimonas brevitalea]|uniref:Sulfonate ABC transporter n=1 Tax=Caldimonas brevitalea TaxID=413882 RepID=A0A0G3BN33_9BURK|nr:ABC transporter permease subunit [Caldimonas brevitalea]AKJ29398.1 sulfonate ABC transporter [Caldimonas brevitalea]
MSAVPTPGRAVPFALSRAGAPAAAGLRLDPWLRRLAIVLSGALLPLGLFGLWSLAVQRGWLAPQILPPPSLVWQSLQELWASGELQDHLLISLRRVAWSVALGTAVGLPLGMLMGLSARARAYLLPSFQVVSQFPVVGWVPLLIIFVGIDEALKVSAISIAVVVPVTVNAYKGIAQVPRPLLEVARVYRLGLGQVLARVVLPAAAPSLFNGLRLGVMQAWLSLVFVELLASSEGIGFLMVWGRQLLQLDLVLVGVLAIGVVGVLLDSVLRWGERWVQRWRPAGR